MKKIQTYYEVLKVTRDAPLEVIKASYRALAQKNHPDVNTSTAAANMMRMLNEAWTVLSDPIKRAEHDRWIAHEELKNSGSGNSSTGQVFQNGKFKFQFQMPWKRHQSSIRKSPEVKTAGKGGKTIWTALHQHMPTLQRAKGLPLVVLIFSTFTVCALSWLTIEAISNKRRLETIDVRTSNNASVPAPTASNEDENRVEKPYVFVPLSEASKDNSAPRINTPTASRAAQIDRDKKWWGKDPVVGNGVRSDGVNLDRERQASTGYVQSSIQEPPSGLSNFTVDNRKGGVDAIARIYLNGLKPATRSLYVKAGEKFTAKGLAPGSYVFRYRFIGSERIYEADRTFLLDEVTTSEGTKFSNVTVTLFKVSDGNMQTKEVPVDQF